MRKLIVPLLIAIVIILVVIVVNMLAGPKCVDLPNGGRSCTYPDGTVRSTW